MNPRSLSVVLLLACCAAAFLPARAQEPLTLPTLVERARTADLRVLAAEAELRGFHGKEREAFWAWFPKFETTFGVAGPTPEARNDALGGPPTTAATLMYDLNFGQPGVMVQTEMNAVLPLFTFGKLAALRQAGKQGVLIGEGLKRRTQDEAAYQVAEAYYAYQFARMGKAALQETRKALDDALVLVKKLLADESSQVSKIDEYKLNYFRQQVEAKLPQAQIGMGVALAAMKLIAGRPDEPFDVVEQDLTAPSFQLPPVEALYERAEAARPEIAMARAGVTAREKEVFIRERQFYPDLGLVGFFRHRYTSNATRQLSPFAYDPYNDLSGGAALALRMTFDVPVKAAQLAQAQAELDKLKLQQQLLGDAIRLELKKLHGDVEDAMARSKALDEATRNARRWATSAYANFELGTGDTRELVDAYTAYATSSVEKFKAWHDVALGLRALSRAVGQDVGPLLGPPPAP